MANVVSFNVYQIDNSPVRQGNVLFTAIDFPAILIFAREANIIVSGVQMNAFIVYNSQQFYVAETVADIETAANAGGGGGGPTIYTGDGSLPENRAVNVGVWELAFQSNKGGDPTMEVAHSLNEWYASFVNGPSQCTLHVDATGATLDKGSGIHQVATETAANGTFTTVDLKTVTVVNGIITSIVD